jgi:hypothetical protein
MSALELTTQGRRSDRSLNISRVLRPSPISPPIQVSSHACVVDMAEIRGVGQVELSELARTRDERKNKCVISFLNTIVYCTITRAELESVNE